MSEEEWRDIEGYEGLYQVSSLGNVRSLNYRNTGKTQNLSMCCDTNGYCLVNLWKDSKRKAFNVHRLVAKAFLPNPSGLPEVNHIDECKTNNCVSNLEFCDHKYNMNYGTRTERAVKASLKPVFCVELKKVFESATEADKQLGIYHTHITACCKGKLKTTGGYHWKYVD